MLIVCPKCFTQYQISDEIKISKTQKCHCSTCGNYFLPETDVIELTAENKKVVEDKKINLEAKIEEVLASERAKEVFSSEADMPTSLFSEPLETKDNLNLGSIPLDIVPEEFKPVASKKTSFLSLLLWLALGAGICYFAYTKKDYLLNKMDMLIVEKLDKPKKQDSTKSVSKDKIQPVVPQSKPEPVVEKKVEPVIEEKVAVYDNLFDSNQALDPLTSKQTEPVASPIEYSQALMVQNISYEIGLNEVGMERLLIKGDVLNTSLSSVALPEAKAVIYNDEDNIVARKRILFSEKTLAGNSEIHFETAVVPSPKSVSKIEVVFDE